MINAQEAELGFSPKRPMPDCDYFLNRAEAELRLAEAAANAKAAEAHRALASAYLGRVFSEEGEGQDDLWRWLRAAREKRQALRSIFASEAPGLAPPVSAPDDMLSDLLGRLDRALEAVDRD